MTAADLAREEVRGLRPYAAAVQIDDTVRLNANEAPWNSGAVGFRRPLNRYPEVRPAKLRVALAERFGTRAERLLVTRGSSEAIDLLIRSFCRPGVDNIVTVTPTFSMYGHYAKIQGAALRTLAARRDRDFAVDADELLAACDDTSRLIFLCSPNNPTGTSMTRQTIRTILEARRGRSLVVVDEAYIEFSSESSTTDLLDDFDNLVVLRTLSKALAFAGARCGALIGAADLIGIIDAVQAPYALATPVVECVEDALEKQWLRQAEQYIEQTIAERERLIDELRRSPLVTKIWPSDANFFLMKVTDVSAMLEQTRKDGVLLRYFGDDLSDCVRVSVGTHDDNNALLRSVVRLGEHCG